MRTGLSLLIACLLTAGLASAQRVTIPLDGEWQIEDSLSPDTAPTTWRHKVQVPGMANLAKPGFPDVDRYLSFEISWTRSPSG
jgi:hypothetical protein